MILNNGIWTEEKCTISGPQNWKMCPWSLHALSPFMWARCGWWQPGPEIDGRASGYKELKALNYLMKGSHSLPGTLTQAYICWVESPVLCSRSSLVISFMYSSVYVSIPIFEFIPFPLPPGNYKLCRSSFENILFFYKNWYYSNIQISTVKWVLPYANLKYVVLNLQSVS